MKIPLDIYTVAASQSDKVRQMHDIQTYGISIRLSERIENVPFLQFECYILYQIKALEFCIVLPL